MSEIFLFFKYFVLQITSHNHFNMLVLVLQYLHIQYRQYFENQCLWPEAGVFFYKKKTFVIGMKAPSFIIHAS